MCDFPASHSWVLDGKCKLCRQHCHTSSSVLTLKFKSTLPQLKHNVRMELGKDMATFEVTCLIFLQWWLTYRISSSSPISNLDLSCLSHPRPDPPAPSLSIHGFDAPLPTSFSAQPSCRSPHRSRRARAPSSCACPAARSAKNGTKVKYPWNTWSMNWLSICSTLEVHWSHCLTLDMEWHFSRHGRSLTYEIGGAEFLNGNLKTPQCFMVKSQCSSLPQKILNTP
jgi:hypothetical protein